MIKNNRVNVILFLLLANLVTVTGITAQAAALQNTFDVEAVKMLENKQIPEAKEMGTTVEMPAAEVIPQIQEQIAEIEQQKIIEAERQAEYEEKLLAAIIFCEAGNQSYEGQVAVGAVVMNRINSEKFPDTMEEVIYQPGQFVPAMTGWLDKVRESSGYTDSAMQAAKDAIQGVNPIGECMFFDQGGYGYQIGAHYFH